MVTRWEVTKAVRASRTLPAPARLIMLSLADIAEVGTAEIPERFTPSLTVLANETGLGRSTVAAHLNTLEADGWIARTRPETGEALSRFERTRYQLLVPVGSPDAGLVPQVDGPGEGLPSPAPGPANPAPGLPGPGAGHRDRPSPDLDQIPSDHSSSSSKELAIPERPEVEELCRHLADRIEKNGSKRPTITKTWRDAARRLLDRDGRTIEQVTRAIDWCQDDEFWRSNILSMPKLREKYDQLRLAAQRTNGANGNRPSTTDQRVAAGLQLAAKYAQEDS
jgi:hypothetical protein